MWKIKFSYKSPKVIASLSNVKTSNRTCEVKATIKILPNAANDRIAVRELPDSKTSIELMNWSDYSSDFLSKNHEGNFEIEISTHPVETQSPSSANKISTKFQIMLDNFSNFTVRNTPIVIVQGIKWRVQIQRKNDDLSLYLIADDETDFRMGSSNRVEAIFKLLPFDTNLKPFTKNFTHNYCWGSLESGIDNFLSWSTFIDKNSKYVMQDKALLLVQFKVDEQTTMWDVNGGDIFEAEGKPKCSYCAKEFGNGLIFSRCGHFYCQNCFSSQPSKTCGDCAQRTYH